MTKIIKTIHRFGLKILRKMRFLPPQFYAKIYYEYHNRKKLNLENPQEFNEKIQWYKVFYHPKILNQLVDKYEVRAYVENKIGKKYLNEIYGVYDTPEAIPFHELPNQFVVKATHASSYNLIVHDKAELNIKKSTQLLKKWLRKNQYYRIGQEWAYKDVKPRLIIEKFLKEEEKVSLTDYKFYCFDGVAKFVNIHIDRAENHKKGFYDLNLKPTPFQRESPDKSIIPEIEMPSNFEEMKSYAEILADKFPFVRVDFYSINGKTIFGEMTFYPADGRKDFYPDQYNKIIGDYFKLPEIKNGEKIITQIQ